MPKPHALAAMFVVAALTTAACSGDSPDSLTVGDTTTPSPTTETTTTETTTTESALPDLMTLPLAEFAAVPDGEREEFALSSMGGIRFSASSDHTTAAIHDSISVFTDPPQASITAPRSVAAIGLVTQSIAGSRIANVGEFLLGVRGVDGATATPTGDAVELFGFRLRGYEITNGRELEEPRLFSSARFGAPVDTEFAPFPFSIMYLAETPAGVLTAGMTGSDESNARQSSTALGTLLETAELTGSGLDAPLPPGGAIEPATLGPPPDPAAVVEDAPPALETLFAPIEAGSYQIPNTGRQLTIDLEDGWHAQPNFPGMVVITRPGSIGPGDREFVMFSDVVGYVPAGSGPRPVGEPEPLDGVDDLIENPPAGLAIADVRRSTVDGVSITRFDIAASPEALCTSDEPCEAALITSYGFSKLLVAGFDHRVWWVEHETGPDTVFFAMALDEPEHLDDVTALVDTIEFL